MTGVIAYVIMLVFAVLFYKERIVMCDAAFQLHSILTHNDFAIQINRFGAVITQVFPLMASKMNLPLQAVALSYSLSFIVFYFGVFLIILLGFKNEKMALVVLLFNTLMVRHSFFWIQCEFVQGAVFTLLYLAVVEHVLNKEKVPGWFYLISPLFLITIIYFYPLLLFVMLFGMMFFMLLYKKKIKVLAILTIIYLTLFVVKYLYFNNYYDNSKMDTVSNIFSEFPHYLRLQSFQSFFQYVRNDYYLVFLFWAINTFYLLYTKRYLQTILMTAFFAGLIFLINVNYPQGFVQFYIESQYLIISIFVAMPFAYLLLEKSRFRNVLICVLIFSVGLSVLRINATRKTYTMRVAYIRNVLKSYNESTAIYYKNLDVEILKFTWPFRFETWMLSSLENEKSVMLSDIEQKENW